MHRRREAVSAFSTEDVVIALISAGRLHTLESEGDVARSDRIRNSL
jgi:hypothetical protein